MTFIRTTTIAALVAAAVGLTSLAPAMAQTAVPAAPEAAPGAQLTPKPPHFRQFAHREDRQRGDRQRLLVRRGGGMGGQLVNLACAPNGAERMEIGFVRLKNRLELTAEQQPLLDALRTAALTAQTDFADSCAAQRPSAKPDMVERLRTRLQLEEARLTAMNTLLPPLESFYASLTDAQKAKLAPQFRRDDRPGRQERQNRHERHERQDRPGAQRNG